VSNLAANAAPKATPSATSLLTVPITHVPSSEVGRWPILKGKRHVTVSQLRKESGYVLQLIIFV
jgi:hypothetical protein